ncbi:MAG: hypothetical protein PWQ51_2393, partial [Methanolobus sp.]|nr:hypothetical protein [Methanolobus sp.]
AIAVDVINNTAVTRTSNNNELFFMRPVGL